MTVESLKLVRTVVGFVRAGVIVQPALSARASTIVQQMKDAHVQQRGADTPFALARTEQVLKAVRNSILPSMEACSASMTEIDAVLVPMRQAQRATEAAQRAARAQASDTSEPQPAEPAVTGRARERG